MSLLHGQSLLKNDCKFKVRNLLQILFFGLVKFHFEDSTVLYVYIFQKIFIITRKKSKKKIITKLLEKITYNILVFDFLVASLTFLASTRSFTS